MSWITENICNFITDLISSTLDFFNSIIKNIFYTIVALNNSNVYVVGACKYIMALSLALVTLLVVKQVLSGYIFETDYDADADPFDLVVRIAETVAVISCNAWLFNTLFSLSKKVSTDLIGSADNTSASDSIKGLLTVESSQLGGMFVCYILMLALMVIVLIVFTFACGLRGCELIVMKLFTPFFALDLLTSSRERWNNFFMGYMIAFFTYGIQILFFNIAIKSLASSSYDKPEYIVGTIAWLFLAIKAPKFLEKYLYTSGASKVASGGMRMVAQTIMMKG